MLTFSLADMQRIGRVDATMLSQQQMMELFFTPDDYDVARVQLKGAEDDACSWHEVQCDEAKNITKIEWLSTSIRLQGSLNFSMLPPKLKSLSMYLQDLIGEVNVCALPQKMEYFGIQACRFTGTLDLGSLPRTLHHVYIMDNKITGIVNLCNLPEGLQMFQVRDSNVEQAHLHIGALPASKLEIRLEKCKIASITYDDPSDSTRVAQ